MNDGYAYIKARKVGAKRWEFLKDNGGLTHLRVHATPYEPDGMAERLAGLRNDNPHYEFKTVPHW
jgi:hypothetical protein